jgi:aminomethyltransferase
MSELTQQLQRTVLHEEHIAAGGRMVPFAGWEMPVQYSGVIPEVRAVREACGVFDVSHMGQLDISGPGATEALNKIVSADWRDVPVGRVAYALLLNEHGGVIDDLMGYRLGQDEWFVVVNASRAEVDEAHFCAHLPAEVTLANRYENQAMLAVQGPQSEAILKAIADLPTIQWRDVQPATIAGASGLLARGGYTGSDGFEFMFKGEDGSKVWRALLEAGAVPCGLGARDVLRLEAGLPLYGHELREEWTPFESGCGFAVKMQKGEFIGREALAAQSAPLRRIRALKMQGKAIAREGYAVHWGGGQVGEITSGTMSPTIGSGIALALLPAALEIGATVEVQIRNALHPAEIVKPPFVPHQRVVT